MIRTGEQYRESIRDGREVWINGERVADVTTHPAFRPLVDVRARIYDMAHDPATSELMAYTDEQGERNAVGLRLPFTRDDWHAKRRAVDAVMDDVGGVVIRVDFAAEIEAAAFQAEPGAGLDVVDAEAGGVRVAVARIDDAAGKHPGATGVVGAVGTAREQHLEAAGMDLGDLLGGDTDVGALVVSGHRLTTAEQGVTAQSYDDTHGACPSE